VAQNRRSIARFPDAELIGRGGYGAVYRAEDPEHGRTVAIKVLSGVVDEKSRRRFDRERQAMGRLGGHPNIMPVYESGYTDTGEAYMVMEFAPGGSLQARLDRQGPVPWAEAVGITIAVANAIQTAHDSQVLHCDIKPDNILIDNFGNYQLTDFGIAAVAASPTTTTSTATTLAHAAPETLEGQPASERIDVYAIGSTFYNLVTGRPPFIFGDNDAIQAIITRTLTSNAASLEDFGVPAAVAAVIGRSMAKDPTQRPESAARLAADLSHAASAALAGPGLAVPPAVGQNSATKLAAQPDPDQTVLAHIDVTQPPPHQTPVTPKPSPFPTDAPPPHLAVPQNGGPWVGTQQPPQGQTNRRKSRALWWMIPVGLLLAGGVLIGVLASRNTGSDVASDKNQDDGNQSGTTTATSPVGTATTGGSVAPTADATTEPTDQASTTGGARDGGASCPVIVYSGTTQKFDVRICANDANEIQYQGADRTSDNSLKRPACYQGNGVFLARNRGFSYLVDAGEGQLLVTDPGGAVVVDHEIDTIVPIGETHQLSLCS